jgi:tetratricopeptide (TPR) repeat protein
VARQVGLSEPAAPAVARFRRDAGAVGGGALLPGGRVLTCVHVVNAALGRPTTIADRPREPVAVDFPLQGVDRGAAHVVAWSPLIQLGEGDLARVELAGGRVAGLAPMVLVERPLAADEELAVFGFPHGRPAGVWKRQVRCAGTMVGGWEQLIAGGVRGYKLQAGFSGCPILDAAGQVVGIFAQDEQAPDVDAGAAIPTTVAVRAVLASDGIALPLAEPEQARREPAAAGAAAQAVRAGLRATWNVPPLRSHNFTGRGEELAALAAGLASERVVALTGLSGIGKTQLAVQYAHRHAADYRLVWWLAAGEPLTLVSDLAALADRLGLAEARLGDQPAAAEAARRWLEQQSAWLLVFDNATEPRVGRPWLPGGDRGHALITSRYAAWGGTAQRTRLQPLAAEQAARLLQWRSGQHDPRSARALAELLGGLALALEQAGAYMEAAETPLADYLTLLDTRSTTLLAYAADDETRTAAATWEPSFEQLRERAPAAADLLSVAAFLAPDDIPRDLFVDNEALPERLSPLSDALAFGDALAALVRYWLITPTADAFTVHRLVQEIARERMSDTDEHSWTDTAIHLLDAALPFDDNDPSTWPATGWLLPHALQACEHAERRQPTPERASGLLNKSGLYLRRRAQLTEAQAAYERALSIDEAAYGPDHPEIAIDVNNLGLVLHERGELDAAQAAHERALQIAEAAHGPDHPLVAAFVSNLGEVLRAQG